MASRPLYVRALRGLGWAALGFFGLSFLAVLAMRWVDPIGSAFIVRERSAAFFTGDAKFHYRHRWVDFERIAPPMRLSVIASEDQKFAEHWGFDFDSINEAIEEREEGKRIRGASTISQQVAKNLFLWPGQSFIRKGFEAYFTLLIEALWPKHRILEVYLNMVEFGRGIYGVEAAAETFFHKPAAKLTAPEAALMAAVLPNPKRFRVDAPSNFIRRRQAWILGQMQHLAADNYIAKLR